MWKKIQHSLRTHKTLLDKETWEGITEILLSQSQAFIYRHLKENDVGNKPFTNETANLATSFDPSNVTTTGLTLHFEKLEKRR